MIDVKNTHASYRIADGKLELLVWKDFDAVDPTRDSATFSKESFTLPNDKRVRWEWKQDSDVVMVNDKQYTLTDGRVILISTQGEGVKVTQVQHDLSKIAEPGISEAVNALAKDNESVRQFVDSAK